MLVYQEGTPHFGNKFHNRQKSPEMGWILRSRQTWRLSIGFTTRLGVFLSQNTRILHQHIWRTCPLSGLNPSKMQGKFNWRLEKTWGSCKSSIKPTPGPEDVSCVRSHSAQVPIADTQKLHCSRCLTVNPHVSRLIRNPFPDC